MFLAAGGVALVAFLIWLFAGRSPEQAVEIAPMPPVATAPLTPPPPPAAAPAASAQGLVLSGVMGSGAILTFPDGAQRPVPIGREFLPGLTLKSVSIDHVIVAGADGDLRLDLRRFGGPVPAAQTAAPAAGGQMGDLSALRLATEPRRVGPDVVGYTIKPGAQAPLIEAAGLRPGDVLLSVNGQALDGDERLFGLPQELAGAASARIEYDRAGQRIVRVVRLTPR